MKTFLLTLFVLITPVSAEPKAGDVLAVAPPMVLCDTKQQIMDIVTAGVDSFVGAQAVYKKLRALPNAKNEPTCIFGAFGNLHIVTVTPLAKFYGVLGFSNAWVIEMKPNDPSVPNAFLLWEELIKAAAPLSAPRSGRDANFIYIGAKPCPSV